MSLCRRGPPGHPAPHTWPRRPLPSVAVLQIFLACLWFCLGCLSLQVSAGNKVPCRVVRGGWRARGQWRAGGGTPLRAIVFTRSSPAGGGPGPRGASLPPLGFLCSRPSSAASSWVALGTLLNPPGPQSPHSYCSPFLIHTARAASRCTPLPAGADAGGCASEPHSGPSLAPVPVTGTRSRLLAPAPRRHRQREPRRGGARAPSSAGRGPCALRTTLTAAGPCTPLCSRFGAGRGLIPSLSRRQSWEVGQEPPAWREAHLLTSAEGPVIAASAVT